MGLPGEYITAPPSLHRYLTSTHFIFTEHRIPLTTHPRSNISPSLHPNRSMVSASSLLFSLAVLVSAANGYMIVATMVSGRTFTLSGSTTRSCDGLPITTPMDIFDWTPSAGVSKIELYTGDNCTGAKRVGVAGRNDVNPNTAYVSHRILA